MAFVAFALLCGLVWIAVKWSRSRAESLALSERVRVLQHAEEDRANATAEVAALTDELSRIKGSFDVLRSAEVARATLQEDNLRLRDQVESLRAASLGIGDVKGERARLLAELDALRQEIREKRSSFEVRFTQATAELERLQRDIGALNEQSELQSFGLYRPHYAFETADEYKQRLMTVRGEQAAMLKAGSAAICKKAWTVDGNAAKGKQLVDRQLKLMLRAFNGETDASVARVRFNNVVALEERIAKTFDQINRLGEANSCEIVPAYRELKIAELRIAFEHAQKVQEEREEQRRIREQMRDDEIAAREVEQAQKEAEREEERFSRALEKARRELAAADNTDKERLLAKVANLEASLAEAQQQKARAISRAQLTRAGHVYIISNEGSFGQHVYKIGMTRREDPEDRVRELGDASVPFGFDVHALIYSEDAPALENRLHKAFGEHRVNLMNQRKEFFAIDLEQIEAIVRASHAQITFTRLAVAEEYRQTVMARRERSKGNAREASATSKRAGILDSLDQIAL
jgi:hypothetical protein